MMDAKWSRTPATHDGHAGGSGGVVEPRPEAAAVPPYVPGMSADELARRIGRPVIKLASNENPLGPSPLAVQAAAAALAGAHRYPHPLAGDLREALAALHRVCPEQVLVANGSDEVIRLLAETYLRPGDRVVVARPGFSAYGRAARLMGARVDEVDVTADGAPDLPAMAAACRGEAGCGGEGRGDSGSGGAGGGDNPHGAGGRGAARMVFLCRPNNPTGGVFDEDAFAAFVEEIPQGCLVVLDEAYKEFDDTPFNGIDWLDRCPGLVVVRTFSKVYGLGGLRLGYGIAAEAIWRPVLTIRDPFSVNSIAQAAGLAALSDHEHLARSLELARQGRQFLSRLAADLGLRAYPSQANFVLIDVGRDAQAVHAALLEHGIIVRPTTSFGLPTCIRVTCGLPEENRRFAEALRAVLAAGPAAASPQG
ncbi:MAG TPA: aminotransferase class I/II-fold pyridoxal phosphate-dependent enzyme [Bacillota bacterium]